MPKKNEKAKQIDKFRDAARTLGCDESEEHFDTALAKVARHKPVAETKDASKSRNGKK